MWKWKQEERTAEAPQSMRTLRVLLVGSDVEVADRITSSLTSHATLKDVGWDQVAVRTTSTLHALHQIDLAPFDIIISGLTLEDGCGLDALIFLQGTSPDTPVVITGDASDFRVAVEAIRGGAAEFVLQTERMEISLPLSVEKALVHGQLRHENEGLQEDLGRSMANLAMVNRKLEKSIQQLEVTARTDELTGLSNRRWLNLMLEGRWDEAQRHDVSLAFLMLDLDGFKQLNDRMGHHRGDELLRMLGSVIVDNCRSIDVAARYGGDEFCLLMPHTDVDAAFQVAQRIANAFRSQIKDWDLDDVHVDVSIGVGHRDVSNPPCAEALVRHADEAMYAAKAARGAAPRVMVRALDGENIRYAA